MAALVFTYRNLGDSGWTPRQVLSMPKQLADWDAALDYVAGLPEVDGDRIAVWGSSLGGGHAIAVAARHPELRAAVAQCPFTDGLAAARSLGPRESLTMFGFWWPVTCWRWCAAKRRFAFLSQPCMASPELTDYLGRTARNAGVGARRT